MSDLHLVRLRLDARRLDDFARRRHLGHDHELGYVVHSALGELFGELAPAPFLREDLLHPKPSAGRHFTVLGYAQAGAADLRGHAEAFADPAVFDVVNWNEGFAAKPMPSRWAVGRRLGFSVRCCPIKRRRGERAGEVDAFLAAADHAPEGTLDREHVYRTWLSDHLERQGGARLVDASLDSFQLVSLTRRLQGPKRSRTRSRRPSAVLSGHLEVRDTGAFNALLARGIGRHRTFGFGLLLLRPARC